MKVRDPKSISLISPVDWAMLKKGNSKNSDLFLFFLERCKKASIFPELLKKSNDLQ